MICPTRSGRMRSLWPLISIVPPKRSRRPIGVTATRRSVRMSDFVSWKRGCSIVRLYPLPGCMGSRRPSPVTIAGDHEPPASTNSSATRSPAVVCTPVRRPTAARQP